MGAVVSAQGSRRGSPPATPPPRRDIAPVLAVGSRQSREPKEKARSRRKDEDAASGSSNISHNMETRCEARRDRVSENSQSRTSKPSPSHSRTSENSHTRTSNSQSRTSKISNHGRGFVGDAVADSWTVEQQHHDDMPFGVGGE